MNGQNLQCIPNKSHAHHHRLSGGIVREHKRGTKSKVSASVPGLFDLQKIKRHKIRRPINKRIGTAVLFKAKV